MSRLGNRLELGTIKRGNAIISKGSFQTDILVLSDSIKWSREYPDRYLCSHPCPAKSSIEHLLLGSR
jgi:hypothetical protein